MSQYGNDACFPYTYDRLMHTLSSVNSNRLCLNCGSPIGHLSHHVTFTNTGIGLRSWRENNVGPRHVSMCLYSSVCGGGWLCNPFLWQPRWAHLECYCLILIPDLERLILYAPGNCIAALLPRVIIRHMRSSRKL